MLVVWWMVMTLGIFWWPCHGWCLILIPSVRQFWYFYYVLSVLRSICGWIAFWICCWWSFRVCSPEGGSRCLHLTTPYDYSCSYSHNYSYDYSSGFYGRILPIKCFFIILWCLQACHMTQYVSWIIRILGYGCGLWCHWCYGAYVCG